MTGKTQDLWAFVVARKIWELQNLNTTIKADLEKAREERILRACTIHIFCKLNIDCKLNMINQKAIQVRGARKPCWDSGKTRIGSEIKYIFYM